LKHAAKVAVAEMPEVGSERYSWRAEYKVRGAIWCLLVATGLAWDRVLCRAVSRCAGLWS